MKYEFRTLKLIGFQTFSCLLCVCVCIESSLKSECKIIHKITFYLICLLPLQSIFVKHLKSSKVTKNKIDS